MNKKVVRRVGVVGALLGVLLFALGTGAWASTGLPGPTPPKIGDPVGANVSPHGGYSSSTNFCLQCHDIHAPAGQYAFLYKASVTAVCQTCHAYFGTSTGPPYDPPGAGAIGTASSRTAYDNAIAPGKHTIGSTSVPGDAGITITEGGWTYGSGFNPGGGVTGDSTEPAGPGTSSDVDGGLYCGSCHTPHGEYGQAINTRKVWSSDATDDPATMTLKTWAEGTQIWWNPPTGSPKYWYLHKDADPAGVWEFCGSMTIDPIATRWDNWFDGTNWQPCGYAQRNDREGQLVYIYGYKLLSAHPNHTYLTFKSWGTDYRDHDMPGWCGACHPSKQPDVFGGTLHNHPTGCTACHGNPAADATSKDFPHTSTVDKFLTSYPDALCISCHTTGRLP